MEFFHSDRYFIEDCSSDPPKSNLKTFLRKVKSRKRTREKINKLTEESIESKEHTSDHVDTSGHDDGNNLELEGSHEVERDFTSTEQCSSILSTSIQDEMDSENSPENEISAPKKKRKKDKISDQSIVSSSSINVEKSMRLCKYEILGAHSFESKHKVKRVLPSWLAHPTIISNDVSTVSDDCNIQNIKVLNSNLKYNLKENNIIRLFPVQKAVIPYQLAHMKRSPNLCLRDLCVSAATGSGKTLAYVIPILHAKTELIGSVIHALVVVPVQELALQVSSVFDKYAYGTGISIGYAVGGTNFELESKRLVHKRMNGSYVSSVDILIATPGRLVEHILKTPGFSLKHLKYIVLDEADRLIDQKSLSWLRLVEKQFDMEGGGSVPSVTFHNMTYFRKRPQKLLFSATLSQDPEKLLQLNLFQPKLITCVSEIGVENSNVDRRNFVGKYTTPVGLLESYLICTEAKKPLAVQKLLSDGWRKVLCFTKSCVEANRLTTLLSYMNKNLSIKELSSLLHLSKREQVIKEFSQGKIDVIVCSDRLARGMDIKNVNYVVMYDVPKYIKGYIHRAGRTGRAGNIGYSITLVTPEQVKRFQAMLLAAEKNNVEKFEMNVEELNVTSPIYRAALLQLEKGIMKQKEAFVNRTKREKRNKVQKQKDKNSQNPN